MAEPIFLTHSDTGVNAPAALGPAVGMPNGTITALRVKLPAGNTDGDAVFRLYITGVEQVADLTIPDGDDEITVSGLSYAVTDDDSVNFRIIAPMPTALPNPPYHFWIYYTADSFELPYGTAPTVNSTGEIALDTSVADFSHGIVKYYSGEELALVAMPVAELTTPTDGHVVAYNATNDEFELVAQSGGGSVPFTAASASGAATLEFAEDTDNGTNKVTLQGPASTADVTVTLPAATGTIVLKDSTDTLINKTIDANGTGNSISNLEVADFAASAIVTAADTISGNDNDTTIPTSAAVKDYADSVAGGSVATDAIWDAKGDIAGGTGANTAARLPVGTNGQFLKADSTQTTGLIWDTIAGGGDLLSTNNLSDLTNAATALTNLGLTATAAEINTLDGITASTAELNILDGVTASAAELNALDGITATVTELNYTDGVTSAIQTQLDAKAPKVNPQLALDASQASDDNYAGITIDGRNNSGGVTQWDAVYINGSSEFVLADANGSGTYPAVGLAVGTVAGGGATTVITHGVVRNDAWTWTVGGVIYLSTTAGGLTQSAPSTSGDKVQVMGIAISADEMLVMPQLTYITIT